MGKNYLYAEIADELRKRIRDHSYPPGARLPGHIRLAREFGVSPITSNRALQELVKEGLIGRRERIGSFVAADAQKMRNVTLIVHARPEEEKQGIQDYIKGCLERAAELGLEGGIHYLLGSNLSSAEWMQQNPTNGYICIGQPQHDTYMIAQKLGRPLVVIGPNLPPGDFFVSEDRKGCTRDLVRTMIEDGYRRIGFIGNLFWPDHRLSRDGYLEGIAGLGLGFRLVRDANEENIGLVVRDLLAEDLGVGAIVVVGGVLTVAALPLIIIQRPQVKIGILRENASVAPLADVCYYGEYFQEEAGRMAVDLLVDVHSGQQKQPTLRSPSYAIHRPRVATVT